MAALLALLKPVAYVSLPFLALQSSPRGRYYTRSLVYAGAMGFAATLGAFFAAGLSLVGRRFDVNHAVARTFYAVAGMTLGLTVEVVGGEEWVRDSQDGGARPCVFMGNHQSMVDLVVIGRLMPKRTSIMAKTSLRWSPLGPFMTGSGAIFIDRGNSKRALQSLDAAVNVMRTLRVSVWMYPEGTRHNSQVPEMLPFKKGGFHLAIQSGLPIVPVVTENYWHMYHSNMFDSGSIRVRVLPPIPTTGLTAADVPVLVARVRDAMLAALTELSTKVPSSSTKPITPPEPASMTSVAAVLSDVIDDHTVAMPEDAVFEAKTNPAPAPSASRESLASSTFDSEGMSASGNLTETEEDDEGMVLVGRPT